MLPLGLCMAIPRKVAQTLIFPLSRRLVSDLFSKKRAKRDFLINVWRLRDGFLVAAGALLISEAEELVAGANFL
jgi:hypothetical protein